MPFLLAYPTNFSRHGTTRRPSAGVERGGLERRNGAIQGRAVSPIPPRSHDTLGTPTMGRFMDRQMPRPEDVSRHHIDSTVMDFLKGERDADWTEVSLVTL